MEPERPSRHIGFYQLLDAMRQPGCPICRLAGWASHRWLESVFYGHVNDAGIREELRRAAGFCSGHTEQVLRLGNPLGGSIIYADVLRHVSDHLAQRPPAACPCCMTEATAVSNAVATLLEHIEEEDVRAAYEAGEGLCLPHLRLALAPRTSRGRGFLEEHERGRLRALAEECESLVGKSDYEHIGCELGPERNAWRRAAHKLAGATTSPRGDR